MSKHTTPWTQFEAGSLVFVVPDPSVVERMVASYKKLMEAIIQYELDVDGDMPHGHREMMKEARAILKEIP